MNGTSPMVLASAGAPEVSRLGPLRHHQEGLLVSPLELTNPGEAGCRQLLDNSGRRDAKPGGRLAIVDFPPRTGRTAPPGQRGGGDAWLGLSMNDFRFAFRTLSRNPGFAAVAVVVLGLGIALTTTVFSVVEGTLLRSLPFPGADRLVDIKSIPHQYRGKGMQTSSLTAFEAWRGERGVVEDMAAYLGGQPVFGGSAGAVRVQAWTVTANLFRMFGGTPQVGRLLIAEETG